MKIYFEAQEDDRLCNPPMAIDVAKALIVFAQDQHPQGDDYMEEHADYLDEIRMHLADYTSRVRRVVRRKERRRNVD